jgi:hypothetical protein
VDVLGVELERLCGWLVDLDADVGQRVVAAGAVLGLAELRVPVWWTR